MLNCANYNEHTPVKTSRECQRVHMGLRPTHADENPLDEMAAGGLSEKAGDRLKRRESNRKLERTGIGASVCTRFFRKTDTALSRSFRVSDHSPAAAPLPVQG